MSNPTAHVHRHKDSGAALVLAVGFMLMVGTISGGLAALATTSMNHRNTLTALRDREYAADGAIENAITQERLNTTCLATTRSITDSSLNSVTIRVDSLTTCDLVIDSNGNGYLQRNVTFSACVTGSPACPAGSAIIRAQVNFEPANGTVTDTYVQYWNVNK
ncbi:MAG: hypothetical protein ABI894_09220 [Ilumatobacteraceae bacterium]